MSFKDRTLNAINKIVSMRADLEEKLIKYINKNETPVQKLGFDEDICNLTEYVANNLLNMNDTIRYCKDYNNWTSLPFKDIHKKEPALYLYMNNLGIEFLRIIYEKELQAKFSLSVSRDTLDEYYQEIQEREDISALYVNFNFSKITSTISEIIKGKYAEDNDYNLLKAAREFSLPLKYEPMGLDGKFSIDLKDGNTLTVIYNEEYDAVIQDISINGISFMSKKRFKKAISPFAACLVKRVLGDDIKVNIDTNMVDIKPFLTDDVDWIISKDYCVDKQI